MEQPAAVSIDMRLLPSACVSSYVSHRCTTAVEDHSTAKEKLVDVLSQIEEAKFHVNDILTKFISNEATHAQNSQLKQHTNVQVLAGADYAVDADDRLNENDSEDNS